MGTKRYHIIALIQLWAVLLGVLIAPTSTVALPVSGDGANSTVRNETYTQTFGLLDAIAPLSEDDFYDPDNPYHVVSDIMGTIAGEALSIVLTGGGKNVCINVCFAEGTLVATEDGLRPIEDIRPGGIGWSFDESTGCATLSPVVRTFESEADEIVEIAVAGETIRVTPEHPFWVDGLGWTPARELRVGMPVQSRLGGTEFVPPTQPALRFSRCSSHSSAAGPATSVRGAWGGCPASASSAGHAGLPGPPLAAEQLSPCGVVH